MSPRSDRLLSPHPLFKVHAVGLYGPRGAGVAEHLDFAVHERAGENPNPIKGTVMDRVDIITGMSCFVRFVQPS